MASLKQTALAAMVWTSGPPWVPGKVSLSISFAKDCLQRTMPPRGPRKSLVRGGGNDVGVGNWAGMNAGGNQSGDVGHIHEEKCVNGLCDFARYAQNR